MNGTIPIWLLVDASNHVYRDFHIGGERALDMFVRRMDLMQEQIHPDRTVVCFDSPYSFRRKIDPKYKANRSVRPAGVGIALAKLREYCHASSIDVVESDGYEADDCIATIAQIASSSRVRSVISSTDKDLRQCLVKSLVTQMTECKIASGRLVCRYMTASDLQDEYGIDPDQWVDYQTIVGDSTDNVVGARGVGDAAARKILRVCGSLAGYYENPWLANLNAKQMAAMANFRPHVGQVQQLVRLATDVPVADAWREAAVG